MNLRDLPKVRSKDRLFKPEKPLVRRLEILDGDQYSTDMGVLWAAYKAGSFNLKEGLTQEEFVQSIEIYFGSFGQVWVVDDRNVGFAKGRGQVGLVLTTTAGLLIEAKFGFFKWASKRNILRTMAAFLNMVKHSKQTGMCVVKTTKDKRTLPDHMKDYGLLFYVGKISDNEYLYSVRGRGSD